MFNLTFSFPLTKNKPHSWDDFSMKQHGRLPRAGSSVPGVRRGERAWPAGPPTQDAKPDSGGQRAAPRPEGPGHQHHARVVTCAHTQPPPSVHTRARPAALTHVSGPHARGGCLPRSGQLRRSRRPRTWTVATRWNPSLSVHTSDLNGKPQRETLLPKRSLGKRPRAREGPACGRPHPDPLAAPTSTRL